MIEKGRRPNIHIRPSEEKVKYSAKNISHQNYYKTFLNLNPFG